jgi:glycine cleavage system H lipoate-binding protein
MYFYLAWFCKIKMSKKDELKALLDAAAYDKYVEGESS